MDDSISNGESEAQPLDPPSEPPPISKRKPDYNPQPLPAGPAAEGGGGNSNKKPKQLQNPKFDPSDDAAGEGEERSGNVKRVLLAVDKGKGIMVEEEEEEEEEDSSDDSSSQEVVGFEGDDGSDLSDDPLAEVDLMNILPSRTRHRPPPPIGAYLLTDEDESDDDDDSE